MPAAHQPGAPTFGWTWTKFDDTTRWPKGWGWIAAGTLSLTVWASLAWLVFG